MELVDGEPLSAILGRHGALPVDRTLHVVRQTAAALAAAHAAGVVHRDIKPGNILVAPDGTVKITDFGIAVSAASAPLTRTGQVIGTAHYLSPEQASGDRATPSSDVYALGAVAYECLTGRRPFEGESSVQIALKQIREQPEPLPAGVPAGVRDLVERAMAKDPAQRFPDGAALLAAVDQVIAGRPTASGPTGTAVLAAPLGATTRPVRAPRLGWEPRSGWEPTRPATPRRFPWPVVGGAVIVLALLAVVVALMTAGGTPTATGGSSAARTTHAIAVSAERLVGRPVAEVQAQLVAEGLRVTLVPMTTSTVPAGQVTAVAPTGPLPPGSTVSVTYAVAPAVTQAPPPTGQGNGNGKGKGKGGGDD
jgi:serine/threonine-protein kinase